MEATVENWFAQVRELGRDGYREGMLLDLSPLTKLHQWSGPESGISQLYVRKEFASLFVSIISVATRGRWLVHLNGNPGIGKSAFLWYFIVRYANEKSGDFSILYQFGDFIWEFNSSGRVKICNKSLFATDSIAKAKWHLVNQKVGLERLGDRVLVAASPNPDNVKPATSERKLAVRFMYPWDKDEFDELVNVWRTRSCKMIQQANEMEASIPGFQVQVCVQAEQEEMDMDVDEIEVPVADLLSEEDQANDVEERFRELIINKSQMSSEQKVFAVENIRKMALSLRKDAREIEVRVEAADTFFSWFGGVPRKLFQLEDNELTEVEMERWVDKALLKTDLAKVYQIIQSGAESEDVSWMLIHFKWPVLPHAHYLMEFATPKIKYKFVSVLGKSKAEDLKALLYSADPEYAALRGFIFEQEVVAKVLHGQINAVKMVDTKHCATCNNREDTREGPVMWIACDYHQLCVNVTSEVTFYKWQCQPCPGKKGKQVLSTASHRRLKYYEGDLLTALLEAGATARDYVFRPLRKNNAAFDFVFVPRTLGQATAAMNRHTESYEAVKAGVEALQAWNVLYNPEEVPETYVLAFFLMRTNYPTFGFQSYRNSRGSVSRTGVKGIVQAKVLVSVYDEVHAEQIVDMVQPNLVENLDDLVFEDIDYQGMSLDGLKDLARSTGLRGYSGLRKSKLIEKLKAWIENRNEEADTETREYERDYRMLVSNKR